MTLFSFGQRNNCPNQSTDANMDSFLSMGLSISAKIIETKCFMDVSVYLCGMKQGHTEIAAQCMHCISLLFTFTGLF